jgi:hypothetical protein
MSCGLDGMRHRELKAATTVGRKAEAWTPSDTHHPTDVIPKPQFTKDVIKRELRVRSRWCFSNRIQANVMGFIVRWSKTSCSVEGAL